MAFQLSLPEPDDVARTHSSSLTDLLERRCQSAPLSFRDYMQAALYEPGYGYYVAGTEKFGQHGDFITAPELTPLFGQTLARQLREILKNCPGDVLEFGAGAGGLADSIIPELSRAFNHYYILEPSAELRQRQELRLKRELGTQQFAQVSWLTSLPEKFNGVILANEILDAFAVERFRIRPVESHTDQRTIEQSCVKLYNDRIVEHWAEAGSALKIAVLHIESDMGVKLPDDYQSELNPDLKPWFSALSECLDQGVVLVIDYGYPRRQYYSAERAAGTLTCYYQHRAHSDPYRYPGLQDITAHVDFTAVIEAADAVGFSLLGYTSQASFLLANGLTNLVDEALQESVTEVDRLTITKAAKTLTLPSEMGERFQVMALGKSVQTQLQGFTQLDLSDRL